MFGKFQEDCDNSFQGLLALTLWREVERRIVILRHRHREQRRKEWNRLLQWQTILAEGVFEFLQLLVGSILSVKR